MSNARKHSLVNLYRTEFLHSAEWFARRDKWFRDEASLGRPLVCAGCGHEARKRDLQLHHLDYTGVIYRDDRWHADEAHTDLVAMHSSCHDLLHQVIDRDIVLSRHRTRRAATHLALEKLRDRLTTVEGRTP